MGEKILNKIDNHINLTTEKLLALEQLFRLEKLSEYYYKSKPISEILSFKLTIEEESLSKNLVLPLKVKGVFLREGRPLRRWYPDEELQIAAKNPLNQKFPLMLDHKTTEAGHIIGVVTKVYYDVLERALKWKGHINNETFARNVIDEAITEVSATIDAGWEDFSEELGPIGRDLIFRELSLVIKGRVTGNSI